MSASQSLLVFSELTKRDFKIRYRNMSLGIFWSILNPLIMVLVLGFVFKFLFPSQSIKSYPVFILCGILPYNFFSMAWAAGTTSINSNSGLIKRVRLNRQIVPLSSVASNLLHFVIQIGLLLVFSLVEGFTPTADWLLIPLLITILVAAVAGAALLFGAFDVYFRDTRYVVESLCLVLFWLSPAFYSHTLIPEKFKLVYILNPIATVAIGMRSILMDGKAPPSEILLGGSAVSAALLVAGYLVFSRMQRRFAEHL